MALASWPCSLPAPVQVRGVTTRLASRAHRLRPPYPAPPQAWATWAVVSARSGSGGRGRVGPGAQVARGSVRVQASGQEQPCRRLGARPRDRWLGFANLTVNGLAASGWRRSGSCPGTPPGLSADRHASHHSRAGFVL